MYSIGTARDRQRGRNSRLRPWHIALIFGSVGVLSLLMAGLLAWSYSTHSQDAAELLAAPRCPAATDCRRDVSAVVLRTYERNTKSSRLHLVMRTADGSEVDVQAPKGVPPQIATPGQPVSITFWRGATVQVQDRAGDALITGDNPAWKAERDTQDVLASCIASLLFFGVLVLGSVRRRRSTSLAPRGLS